MTEWQTVEQTKAVKRKSWWCFLWWIVVLIVWTTIVWLLARKSDERTMDAIWQQVQARVDYVNDLFWELSKFEKAECVWDCKNLTIALYFSEELDKGIDWMDVDNVARWQAYNLTNEIWLRKATAQVYVKWELKETCTTREWEAKIDYCNIGWVIKYNTY